EGLSQRRGNGRARLYGGWRRGSAYTARRAGAGRPVPDIERGAGRDARSSRRNARPRRPTGGDFPFFGSTAFDPRGKSPARGAEPPIAAPPFKFFFGRAPPRGS